MGLIGTLSGALSQYQMMGMLHIHPYLHMMILPSYFILVGQEFTTITWNRLAMPFPLHPLHIIP